MNCSSYMSPHSAWMLNVMLLGVVCMSVPWSLCHSLLWTLWVACPIHASHLAALPRPITLSQPASFQPKCPWCLQPLLKWGALQRSPPGVPGVHAGSGIQCFHPGSLPHPRPRVGLWLRLSTALAAYPGPSPCLALLSLHVFPCLPYAIFTSLLYHQVSFVDMKLVTWTHGVKGGVLYNKQFLIELIYCVFLCVLQVLLKKKPNSHFFLSAEDNCGAGLHISSQLSCDILYCLFIDKIKTIWPLIYALLMTKSKLFPHWQYSFF